MKRQRYGVGPISTEKVFCYHFDDRDQAIRLANEIEGFVVYDFGCERYLTAEERRQEVRS